MLQRIARMKTTKTKAQVRAELDAQMGSFLADGGAVEQFERGESGRLGNEPLHPTIEGNPQGRTPVLDEIKAIEARRLAPKNVLIKRKNPNGDQKTLIVDDFGEPLRWV